MYNDEFLTNNNPYELYKIAKKYYFAKEYDTMKMYYNKSLDKFEINNDMKELYYYDEYNSIHQELGDYYKDIERNYDLMKIYYEKSIEFHSAYSSASLADYYKDIEEDYNKALKYYLLALTFDKNFPIKSEILSLEMFYTVYQYFENNKLNLNINLNENEKEIFKEFETIYFKLINKIKLNSHISECIVCNENDINIYIDCSHKICLSCLSKISKCPVCKCNISHDYSYNEN